MDSFPSFLVSLAFILSDKETSFSLHVKPWTFCLSKLVLVTAWLRVHLTTNLTSGNQGASEFSESFGGGKFNSIYHESNLSLSARETMRLLVNHQLITIAIQPKSISLEQICYKRSHGIDVTSVHCLLFSTSKNKGLKRFSKSATNVVLALKFLWTTNFVFL